MGPEQGMHHGKFAECTSGMLLTSQDSVKDFINFTAIIKRNKKTIMEIQQLL